MASTTASTSFGRADAPPRPRSRTVPLRGLALAGTPVALLMALSAPLGPWVFRLFPSLDDPWRLVGLAAVLALGAIGLALLAGAPRGLDRSARVMLGGPAVMVGISLAAHGAVLFLATNLPSGLGTQGQTTLQYEITRATLEQSRTLPAVLALAALVVVAVQARSWPREDPAAPPRSTSPALAAALAGVVLLGALVVALIPTLLSRRVLPFTDAVRLDPWPTDYLGGMTGGIAEATAGLALLLGIALTARATRSVRAATLVLLGLLGLHMLVETIHLYAERRVAPVSEVGRILHDSLPLVQVWGFVACAVLGVAVLIVSFLGERR
ncbi:hypothetical protein [Brachybacterium squillarum]|uniref:hypothetical protein n=1 Tax=Brachybacterium squillarum TaxID=661979 RepID=UPI0002629587|nr:hypothetical protein [Brachybacterium squillarum]